MNFGLTNQQLLEKYGAYVRSIALTVQRQFHGRLDLDDLLSFGQLGLFEAAQRFDSKVGANFLTFAHYRIKGAIFDGLRRMGILRGSDAHSLATNDQANAYLGNLADRNLGNFSTSFDDDVHEISDAVTGLATVFAVGMGLGVDVVDGDMNAEERLEFEQLRERVKLAFAELPANEKQLLETYYFQQKTLEEAGAVLKLSKSWASRLHARAIDRIKDFLEKDGVDVGPSATKKVSDGSANARNSGRPARGTGVQGGPSPPREGRAEPVRPAAERAGWSAKPPGNRGR